MAVGPGWIGPATARAGLFGIDFFGGDDKSEMHHPRPGSEVSAQAARSTAGVAAVEAPTATVNGLSVNTSPPIARGGGLPRAVTTPRSMNLPRVSSAPSTRSVVIRRAPASIVAAARPAPPQSPPSAVALAAPPPEVVEPEARPAPEAPPAPSPLTPRAVDPVPDSYRVGYAEYLRAADTGDLLVAALPGVAGIAGFTLVGAYAGYRQARAVQRAFVAPVATSILL